MRCGQCDNFRDKEKSSIPSTYRQFVPESARELLVILLTRPLHELKATKTLFRFSHFSDCRKNIVCFQCQMLKPGTFVLLQIRLYLRLASTVGRSNNMTCKNEGHRIETGNNCKKQRQKSYLPLVGSLRGNNTSSESLASTTELSPESTVPTSSAVNSANS